MVTNKAWVDGDALTAGSLINTTFKYLGHETSPRTINDNSAGNMASVYIAPNTVTYGIFISANCQTSISNSQNTFYLNIASPVATKTFVGSEFTNSADIWTGTVNLCYWVGSETFITTRGNWILFDGSVGDSDPAGGAVGRSLVVWGV